MKPCRSWPALLSLPALLPLLAVLMLAPSAGAAAEERAAALLRRTPLVVPPSVAGLQSSPEVSVRLRVDTRGRIAEAEVLAIEPSSELDAALSAEVLVQLDGWRFAPAMIDGSAVESTVHFRVQFRDVPESREATVETMLHTFSLGEARRRAVELSRLGLEERQQIIERFARVAESNLDPASRRRAESPRFVAISDARDEGVAEALARNLEATWNQFSEILGRDLEPQPERYKLVAYLFASRASYADTRIALRDGTVGEGFYAAPGFLAFHQESIDPGEVLSTLIHESFHAFSDRLLRRPGRPGEPWLEEGLAEYFGNSEVKKGELVPGRTLHRKFLMHYGQVFKLRTQAGISVAELKRAVGSGDAPTIRELVEATHQEFYGERLHLYYGTAWLLVHFLRHGEPEWRTGAFPQLLLYLYEGYPAAAALESVYGTTVDDLEGGFARYVRGF
ncbi:MAG TPA: energy transducer TonB [Thermoanaerobaculia bacterium]|nr:energy transducer TonB [Thermoanaerobaculia bacterium]